MHKPMEDKKSLMIFIFPAVLIYTFIIVIPVIQTMYYSMFEFSEVNGKSFIFFSNYVKILKDALFWRALINTIMLTALSVFFQLAVALTIALLITSIKRFQVFFKTIFYVPNVLSTVVIGTLWMYLFNYDYGLLNQVLKAISFESIKLDWLGDRMILVSFVLVASWQWIGYYCLMYITAINNIPYEVKESIKLEGVKGFVVIKNITIPMIWPTLRLSIILMLIACLRFFDLAWIMTNNSESNASLVVATYLYRKAFIENNYGYGSALATILFIKTLVISIVVYRTLNKEENKIVKH